MEFKGYRTKRLAWAGVSGLALLMGVLGPASAAAQDVAQAPAAEPEADQLDAVIVTGSRIRRNGFESPNPLTVLSSELTRNLGQTNAADIIKMIPQNFGTQSDATAGSQASPNVGSSYVNLRGLNPLGGTRTLTLVNSRRFVPTSDGGAVDLNMIPSSVISRMETVTGGASAAYGSDAIAGVVNVILETKLQGFRGEVDYGQTTRDDGKNVHASMAWGDAFAGGRGHVLLGLEYQDQKGIGDCAAVRKWCAESWDVYTNASNILPGGAASGYNVPGSPGYGLPNFVVGPNSKQAYNDPFGVVRDRSPTAPAARNKRFNADGTDIVSFDPGMFVSSALIGARQGGDGASTYADSDIRTPIERYVGFLRASYELNSDWEVFGEFSYAERTASATSGVTGPRSTFFVKPTNPYLPASLVSLLAGTQFSIGKDLDGQFSNLNRAEVKVARGVVGVTGALADGWTLDAYYQYGRNERRQVATRSRVNTPFIYALDAVRDPATGQIVCAELLKASPNPVAKGCAPLNLFGTGNISQAAIDYVYRPVEEDFVYEQHVVSASVSGELFRNRDAGPIGVAAGVDYRDEGGDVTHGDIPNYNDYAFTFGLDYAGSIKVLEPYAEITVPVFRDGALGKALEVNGAVRWTRNRSRDDLTGDAKTIQATSWKASAIYDPIEGLRLRGTRSRDIRAAGFRELFLKQIPTDPATAQGIVDNPNIPGSPASGDDPTPILSGGNFALGAEKADTTTLGAVLTPGFIPGFTVSADWYQIKIRDAVSALTGQRLVDFCFRDKVFCDRITFASPTNITFVDATRVNLGRFVSRGVDIEAAYRFPLDRLSAALPGTLDLRVMGTYQYDFIVQPSSDAPGVDYAGQSSMLRNTGDFTPAPKWVWNGFLVYSADAFTATLKATHIGKGKLNVERIGPDDPRYSPQLINSISDNTVDSATYFSLGLTYRVTPAESERQVEVFSVVENLFDKKPPVAPGGGSDNQGSDYPTNPAYFDTFGARYKVGARVRF